MQSMRALFHNSYTQQEVEYQTAFERNIAEEVDKAKNKPGTALALNYIGTELIGRYESHLLSDKKTRLILPKTIFTNDPIEFFSRLTVLTLNSNDLTEIPAGSFDLLAALKEISLRANRLKKLPETLFTRLPVLETIDLSQNSLKTLAKTQFKSQQVLKHLHLGNQGEEFTLSKKTLVPLATLTTLILDDNPMLKISQKSFESLKNLEVLGLNKIKNLGNFLKSNPEFLLQFPNLRKVGLSLNVLKKIPDLPATIEHLKVGRCGIKEFSLEDITKYTSLKYLDISSNPFEQPLRNQIPANVQIYISDNTLSAFAAHA